MFHVGYYCWWRRCKRSCRHSMKQRNHTLSYIAISYSSLLSSGVWTRVAFTWPRVSWSTRFDNLWDYQTHHHHLRRNRYFQGHCSSVLLLALRAGDVWVKRETHARDTGAYPHCPLISASLDVHSSGPLVANLSFETHHHYFTTDALPPSRPGDGVILQSRGLPFDIDKNR